MKKAAMGKVWVKGGIIKSTEEGKAKSTTRKTSTKSNSSTAKPNPSEKKNRKSTTSAPTEVPVSAVQTEADERRLRKLKVFLKSVSYNGTEGTILPNLNDLYSDQLLVDEFPCNELLKTEEFKCNPTPFVVASCFNRTQVTEREKKGARRTPKKQTTTPRKRNNQTNDPPKTSHHEESAIKPYTKITGTKLKIFNIAISDSTRKLLKGQGDKLKDGLEREEKMPGKSTVRADDKEKHKTSKKTS